MTNYISAEKLIAEIKRRLKSLHEWKTGWARRLPLSKNKTYYKNLGKESAYDAILNIIDSFEQEQPKPSGYDKGLLEVKRMVDKLYDEASIGLNEYDSGLYNGIAETCMKLRGFIKARLAFDEQPDFPTTDEEIEMFLATHPKVEVPNKYKMPDWLWKKQDQPDADLEKEIEKYCRIYYNCNYPDQIQNGRCSSVMSHIVEAARHFYELGLNARKDK